MNTRMKLVTANDESLFEQRMARLLASLPSEAAVVEIAFDTCPTESGGVHYSALLRIEAPSPWD